MTFVPIVVVPTPPPSPQAQELSRRLRETIDGFCRDHPETSPGEIRQAMSLAKSGLGTKGQGFVVALVAGLALLGVLVFFLFGRQLPLGGRWPILAIIAVGGVLLAVLAAFLRRR